MTNYESFKALEIKTLIVFNLVFANNTIFYHALFLFLNYRLIFLIPAVIAQIFNPIVELVTAIGVSSKQAKPKIETKLVKVVQYK